MKNIRIMVARCTPNGQLDTTFGNAGKTVIDFPAANQERPNSLAIGPQGKIVVASVSYTNNQTRTALVQCHPNGKPDLGFGLNGTRIIDMSELTPFSSSFRSGLAVNADGKIVMAGTVAVNGKSYFRLMRVNENGHLDTTFGPNGNGKTLIDFGTDAWGYQLAFDSNGRLVVTGVARVNNKRRFALARCLPDGQLDLTFGTQGKTVLHFPGIQDWYCSGHTIDLVGRLVAAGVAVRNSTDVRYALARCLPDGKPDLSIGTWKGGVKSPGVIIHIDPGNEFGFDLTIDSNGKLVIAGAAMVNGSYRAVLMRRLSDGKPDTTFGTDGTGRVLVDFPESAEDYAVSVQIDANGRLVIAGAVLVNGYRRVALARYNANGAPDLAFGPNGTGRAIINFPQTAHEAASSLLIDSTGNLIISGFVADGGPEQPQALQKPSTTGSPMDILFGPAAQPQPAAFAH